MSWNRRIIHQVVNTAGLVTLSVMFGAVACASDSDKVKSVASSSQGKRIQKSFGHCSVSVEHHSGALANFARKRA